MELEALFSKEDAQLVYLLTKLWQTKELVFIGRLDESRSPNEKGFGYLSDLVVNDRKIFYPRPVKPRIVSIRVPISADLELGSYYKVYTKLAPPPLRQEKNNPYLLVWDDTKPIMKEANYLPAEAFIKKLFTERGQTPQDASTIAGQLKLNELELYTQTERFIFELLQNADDMPSLNKRVVVDLEMLGDFFLFMHNGKFFDREDIQSISDAAKSTKSKDKTKTGYKGIGFKSVFTDSKRVFIRSGDYSFKFDKLHPVYQDFWKLYRGYLDKLVPHEQTKFRNEYSGQEDQYLQIEKIPWQIKPIWVPKEETPSDLFSSSFCRQTHNVSIALQIGANVFNEKDYAGKIIRLLSEPRFLLFLRNIETLSFKQGDKTIVLNINKNSSLTEIEYNGEVKATYIKDDFNIPITDESFLNAGLNLQKRTIDEGKFEFTDDTGKKLEHIPAKLSMLDATTISFAAEVKDGRVLPLKKNEAILFNYLPTSDKHYEFPFLVNGDFISNTAREFILKENIWNQYLFFHIGYQHVEWVQKLLHQKVYESSYLNILCPQLFDENEPGFEQINRAFNSGYKKAIDECAFILTDRGQTAYCRKVILDETSISVVLGHEAFYALFGTDKALPLDALDQRILKKKVFGIEKISLDAFVHKIFNNEANKIKLEGLIELANEEQYGRFLKWLDDLLSDSEGQKITSTFLSSLKFIRLTAQNGYGHYSWKELKNQENKLLMTVRYQPIHAVLGQLGFTLSTFAIDPYSKIKEKLNLDNTYVSNDEKLFQLICTKCEDCNLQPINKVQLADFFLSLPSISPNKIARNLLLFNDISGYKQPLFQLLAPDTTSETPLLEVFQIDREEWTLMGESLQKLLCTHKRLYKNLLSAPDKLALIQRKIYNEMGVADFYALIEKYYALDPHDDKPGLSELPLVVVETPLLSYDFYPISEVYYSEALLRFEEQSMAVTRNTDQEGLSWSSAMESQYQSLLRVCSALTDLKIPLPISLKFINKHQITYLPIKLSDQLRRSGGLKHDDAQVFLNYLIQEGDFIFRKGYFEQSTGINVQFQLQTGYWQYYTANATLSHYTQTLNHSRLKILPNELVKSYQELQKIGLLTDMELVQLLLRVDFDFQLGFGKYILDQSIDIKKSWLSKLTRLELNSNEQYSFQDEVGICLRIALELHPHDDAVFEDFRSKVYIDGIALTAITYQDIVEVTLSDGDQEMHYCFSLARLLPQEGGHSEKITLLLKNLIGFKDQEVLQNGLFEMKCIAIQDVFDKLRTQYSSLENADQYVFLQLYRQKHPNAVMQNFNASALTNRMEDVLEFCFQAGKSQKNRYPVLKQFIAKIKQLDPVKHVYPGEFAHPCEQIPEWLDTWIHQGEIEKRLIFLKHLGMHTANSIVVSVRKFFLATEAIEIPESHIIELQKKTPGLLKQTIDWLQTTSKVAFDNHQQKAIRTILDRMPPEPGVPLPVVIAIGDQKTSPLIGLKEVAPESHLIHLNTIPSTYVNDIFNHFATKDNYHFITEFFPHSWESRFIVQSYLEIIVEKIDIEALQSAQPLFEGPYLTWALRGKYPVLVIDDLIPRITRFHDFIVKRDKHGTQVVHEGKFYIHQDEVDRLDEIFRAHINTDDLVDWLMHTREPKKVKQPIELEEQFYTYEEKSQMLDQVFGNNIPKDCWKDQNLMALIKGLQYLEAEGWDVSDAKEELTHSHHRSVLQPVYRANSYESIRVICQSAMGGLLYLKPSTWGALEEANTYLYVSHSNDPQDCTFCASKNDLLDPASDYFILRFEGGSEAKNLDNFLNGELQGISDIRIILRSKKNQEYDSIFKKIAAKDDRATMDNVLIGSENNEWL
jgi:hypothetical protein